MTTSNLHRLIRARESSPGVLPGSPVWERAYITDETLKPNDGYEQSQTITGKRPPKSILRNSVAVGGSLTYEWAFGDQADWEFEMGMHNPWIRTPEAEGAEIVSFTAATDTIVVNTGATFVGTMLVRVENIDVPANDGLYVCQAGSGLNTIVVGAGGTLTDTGAQTGNARIKVVGIQAATGDLQTVADGIISSALDFTTMTSLFMKGGLYKIGSGVLTPGGRFATAGVNRLVSLLADPAANKLTLGDLGASWAVDNGATKDIIIWTPDQILDHGSSAVSEQYERSYQGQAAPEYMRHLGVAANQWTVPFARKSAVRATLNLLGFRDSHSSSPAEANPVEPTLGDPFITGSSVGEVTLGGQAPDAASFIKSATFDLNNNLQPDGPLNSESDTVYDLGDAILQINNLNTRFGTKTEYEKFRAKTKTSMLLPIYQAHPTVSGKYQLYAMKAHAMQYIDGDASPGGRNNQVDFRGVAQGFEDPVTGKMLSCARFEEVGL